MNAVTWILLAAIVVAQGTAGAVAWRWAARRPMTWIEAAGMGLALGSAGSAVGGCVGFWLPIGSALRTWAFLWPAVVVLVLWGLARLRESSLPRFAPVRGMDLAAVAVAIAAGVATVAGNARAYPLTWTGTWPGYHQDMVFFEAVATGTSTFAPTDSVFMVGADLRYHWLAYAWTGQLTAATDAVPFAVLTRVLPVVALAASVLIAVAWARRLSSVPWVPLLSALLIVTGGYVGAVYGAILNFDSPSQALATAWLLALVVAFLAGLRVPRLTPLAAVVAVLALAVAGGKVSAIVAAGGGFAAVVLLAFARRRRWRWRALLLAVIAGLGLLATFVLMVSGSAQSGGLGLWSLLDRASSVQGLNPQTTPRGIMAGTALLMVAIAFRWAGLAWLVASRRYRWAPTTWLGLGCAVVGLATVALLSGGVNDMWFALAASAPLSVLSAVGAGRAAAALGPRRSPVAFAIGLIVAVPVALVWATGAYSAGGWRWAAPVVAVVAVVALVAVAWVTRGRADGLAAGILACLGLAVLSRPMYLAADRLLTPPAAPHDLREFAPVLAFTEAIDRQSLTGISWEAMEAGRALRSAAGDEAIVATNVTYSPLVPAVTGVRTLVSGIHYQAPYGRPDALEPLLERERLSWAFVDAPTSTSARALCSLGVGWVWVDPARTPVRDWSPWAFIVHDGPEAIVLRLDACER